MSADPTPRYAVYEQLATAVIAEVQKIPAAYFETWPGGWPNQIGMALLDAVHSKQAVYKTKKGKGVLPRLQRFAAAHPNAASDLNALRRISESEIQSILGKGVTNKRSKASAVLEAAKNFTEGKVYVADDFDPAENAHREAYLDVHGLGPVTFNYFGMLLGHPNLKIDTWLLRFVARVADEASLNLRIDKAVTRDVLLEAHQRTGLGKTITHFDHAVWLYEQERP